MRVQGVLCKYGSSFLSEAIPELLRECQVRSHRRSPERDRSQVPLQKGGSMRWRSRSPVSSYEGRDGEPPRGRVEPSPIPPDANNPMMRMPGHFPPGGMGIPPMGLPPPPFDVGLGPGHPPGMPGPLHDPVLMERLRREREEREGFEHRRRVEREERRGRSEGSWRGVQREGHSSMEAIRGGEGRRSPPPRDEDAAGAPDEGEEEEEPEEGELVMDSLSTQVSPSASTNSKKSPRSSRWGDARDDTSRRVGIMDNIAATALNVVLPKARQAGRGDDDPGRGSSCSQATEERGGREGSACRGGEADAEDGEEGEMDAEESTRGEGRRDDSGRVVGDLEIQAGEAKKASDDSSAREAASRSKAVGGEGRGGDRLEPEKVERGSRNGTGGGSCGILDAAAEGQEEKARGDSGVEKSSKRDAKRPLPEEQRSEQTHKEYFGQSELDVEEGKGRSPSRKERNGGAKREGKIRDGETRSSPRRTEMMDSNASGTSKEGAKTEAQAPSASGRRPREVEGLSSREGVSRKPSSSASASSSRRGESQRSDPGNSRPSHAKVGAATAAGAPKGNRGDSTRAKGSASPQTGSSRDPDRRGMKDTGGDASATGEHEGVKQRANDRASRKEEEDGRRDVSELARAKRADASGGGKGTSQKGPQDARPSGKSQQSSCDEGSIREGGVSGTDGSRRRSTGGEGASCVKKNHRKRIPETAPAYQPSPRVVSGDSGADAEEERSVRSVASKVTGVVAADESPRGGEVEAKVEGSGVKR